MTTVPSSSLFPLLRFVALLVSFCRSLSSSLPSYRSPLSSCLFNFWKEERRDRKERKETLFSLTHSQLLPLSLTFPFTFRASAFSWNDSSLSNNSLVCLSLSRSGRRKRKERKEQKEKRRKTRERKEHRHRKQDLTVLCTSCCSSFLSPAAREHTTSLSIFLCSLSLSLFPPTLLSFTKTGRSLLWWRPFSILDWRSRGRGGLTVYFSECWCVLRCVRE